MSNISTKMLQAAAGAQTGNPWDISGATLSSSFSVSSESDNPQALFFKGDGSKMYITDLDDEKVYGYDLSTNWDITSASYVENFTVISQEVFPRGLFFKPDGTRMYISGNGEDEVNEYNLSTAWDVGSASFSRVIDISTEEAVPRDVFFKPDGTRMYVVGSIGDEVNEFNLSGAWNVTTASASRVFSVSSEDSSPSGLFFKEDGLKMYVVGNSGDAVHEYDLSTAWNVTTASLLQSFSVASEDGSPTTVSFKDDGTVMYVMGNTSKTIYAYDL